MEVGADLFFQRDTSMTYVSTSVGVTAAFDSVTYLPGAEAVGRSGAPPVLAFSLPPGKRQSSASAVEQTMGKAHGAWSFGRMNLQAAMKHSDLPVQYPISTTSTRALRNCQSENFEYSCAPGTTVPKLEYIGPDQESRPVDHSVDLFGADRTRLNVRTSSLVSASLTQAACLPGASGPSGTVEFPLVRISVPPEVLRTADCARR